MSILTMAELREEFGGNATNDARLQRRYRAALNMWDQATNRKWLYETDRVQYWNPEPTETEFYLELYPVTAIAVKEWPQYSVEADGTVTDAALYRLDGKNGMVVRENDGVLPNWAVTSVDYPLSSPSQYRLWQNHVKFTYTGGYTSDTIPVAIKDVLIDQIRFMMARNTDNLIHISSQSIHRASTTFKDGPYCDSFLHMAKAYRRGL